jgi:hypothetical protein
MEDTGDAVLGIVERSRLNTVLTAVHRGGQGHNARVIDASRGDIPGQLQRAGVTETIDLSSNPPDTVVVLIHAPGRIAKTTEMLQRAGADPIHVVSRVGAETPRSFTSLPTPVVKSRSRRTVPHVLPPLPVEQPSPAAQIDD